MQLQQLYFEKFTLNKSQAKFILRLINIWKKVNQKIGFFDI
jgi:hypothetical protein